jgi:CheY-like chemotaxis protein
MKVGTNNNHPLREKHILLVDDDPSFLKSLELMLASRGARVSAFTTAGEGLRSLREEDTFDLVILDIMMDGMDGLEMFEVIREELGNREVAILFISALFEVKHARFLNKGPSSNAKIVPKACAPEQLLDEIGKMLQTKEHAAT